MITVRIKGGLGNQLFQYAAAYALSRQLNQEMKMDISFFPEQSLRSFKLHALKVDTKSIAEKSEIPAIVRFFSNRYVHGILKKLNCRTIPVKQDYIYCVETRSRVNEWFFCRNEKDIFIEGYFQSDEYFKECRKELVRQFRQNYAPEQEYVDVLDSINHCTSVAVHVRRGDFLKVQHNSNPNHYLLGAKYYHNAISYVENAIDTPVFFWFSDDIDWVKENFGERSNYVFVTMHTKNPDIDELMLMKNCKHIIAANSTFSWWASWLNENENAMHICPSKRYGNIKMIPEKWIKIPVE